MTYSNNREDLVAPSHTMPGVLTFPTSFNTLLLKRIAILLSKLNTNSNAIASASAVVIPMDPATIHPTCSIKNFYSLFSSI